MREAVREAVRAGVRAGVRAAVTVVVRGVWCVVVVTVAVTVAAAAAAVAATVVVTAARAVGGVSGWRALATSFRFFVAFFTVTRLGSSSSGETGGAFTSWHAVHVVFRPGSPALSNLRNARIRVCVACMARHKARHACGGGTSKPSPRRSFSHTRGTCSRRRTSS